MSYSSIKQNGYWKDTANTLNYNFNRIDTEISELDGKVTKGKGLFKTDSLLKASIPNPEEGDWALVGTSFPAQVWIESGGTWINSGGTSGETIDLNLTEYIQSEKINEAVDILEVNLLKVTITCSPTLVEYTGKNQTVTVTWTVTEAEEPVHSGLDLFKIIKDGSTIDVGQNYNSSTTVQVNKEGSTYFQIQAAKDGKTAKTATTYYYQYRAMYFGTSTKTSPETITPTEFTKQTIKTSPAGNYTITNTTGTSNYLWLCIPANMNLNKVSYQEGGKENIPITLTTTKDNYKLYKSNSPVNDTAQIKITIS